MSKHKRRIKLINPRLQLKLVMIFVGMSALALLVQIVFLTSRLTQIATYLPTDGTYLMSEMTPLLVDTMLISFGVILPITISIGILVTFRIAGPLYRFEKFLKGVARGDQFTECKIRKGDELQEFCDLLNEATRPLRDMEGVEAGPEERGEPKYAQTAA